MRQWEKIYQQMRPTHFYCDCGVLYASIPKNSSKQWRGPVFKTIVNIDEAHKLHRERVREIEFAFAIVRDPHARLLSGLREYKKRKHRPETIDYMLDNFAAMIPEHDEHLIPQHYFIEEWDFNLVNFNQQTALKAQLAEYNLKQNQRLRDKPAPPDPLENSDTVKHIVQTYYPTDLELWNAVN